MAKVKRSFLARPRVRRHRYFLLLFYSLICKRVEEDATGGLRLSAWMTKVHPSPSNMSRVVRTEEGSKGNRLLETH